MSSNGEVRPTTAACNSTTPGVQSATEDLPTVRDADEQRPRAREAIVMKGATPRFDEQIGERIQRNVDAVSKRDIDFSLYWIKAKNGNQDLNRELTRLCRQEDILCYNAGGEFIAILTGANYNGVLGFEARIEGELGHLLRDVKRGFAVYLPGEPTESLASKAFVTTR